MNLGKDEGCREECDPVKASVESQENVTASSVMGSVENILGENQRQ